MLADVTMTVRVAVKDVSQTGELSLPIPSDYSGQTVIAFRINSEPKEALTSWSWRKRPDGLNRQVEAKIRSLAPEVTVSYTARVLVPGFEVSRTQHKDFANWLRETTSVPANAPSVQKIATELKTGNPERGGFVGRVVRWVAAQPNLAEFGFVNSSNGNEDSYGRATLCAAILRSAKIPARLVAHVPNWGERLDAEFWLTEYQSDEGAWEMVQPVSGIQFPVRNSVIVLSTSSRRDESQMASNPSALIPVAPSLSTPEISSELVWAASNTGIRHTNLKIIRTFPRQSGARLMSGAFRRSLKVAVAGQKGVASWYDEATFQKVLKKGPTNLALYLDERPTMPDRIQDDGKSHSDG
jgi:hypothetical protein